MGIPQSAKVVITQEIISILKQHDVVHAALFGSFVRGEATEQSDLDLLIEFGNDKKSLLDLVGVQQELEEKLQRKVDVLTYQAISPLLKDHILQEKVDIY